MKMLKMFALGACVLGSFALTSCGGEDLAESIASDLCECASLAQNAEEGKNSDEVLMNCMTEKEIMTRFSEIAPEEQESVQQRADKLASEKCPEALKAVR